MNQAQTILSQPSTQHLDLCESTAIARDQYWNSETTVWIFDDNSRIAGSSDFPYWEPTQEEINELERAEKVGA